MATTSRTDEDLLDAHDAAAFEELYLRHVEAIITFFVSRTRDAEEAAELTAETFASALVTRSRYDPRKKTAVEWLRAVAEDELARAGRTGTVGARRRRRLGIERIALTASDRAHILSLSGAADEEPASGRD